MYTNSSNKDSRDLSEYPDYFNLNLFWEEEIDLKTVQSVICEENKNWELDTRVKLEVKRILEKIEEKKPLESRELQIYSLHITMSSLPWTHESQIQKYNSLINEVLDYKSIEDNSDQIEFK